jgi:hypothetical protein
MPHGRAAVAVGCALIGTALTPPGLVAKVLASLDPTVPHHEQQPRHRSGTSHRRVRLVGAVRAGRDGPAHVPGQLALFDDPQDHDADRPAATAEQP